MGNILLQFMLVMGVTAPVIAPSSSWVNRASLGETQSVVAVFSEPEETLLSKAEKIDDYFKEHKMPLEGFGEEMVKAAEKNGLDWRLLPAISVQESTGGKQACRSVSFNPFGWASCKIGFKSYKDAIHSVAAHLGGRIETTASYYADATTEEILHHYNGSVVPSYPREVLAIMKTIGNE
jgi:hypothetical protein